MRITPRTLQKTAFVSGSIPFAISLLAHLIIWCIPGCNPNPYSLGQCTVGTINWASFLLIAGLGGFYLGILVCIFISIPLCVVSVGFKIYQKRKNRTGPNSISAT